jgi:DNA (cytosine-5)-methyltransferase 1
MTIKVLNLYAGIGGNRKLWTDVEVTAVEYKQEIANIYSHFFPQDEIVIADAHQYLLEHFNEFDFIWSSPPCPTHSQVRKIATFDKKTGAIRQKPVYPDMKLYEEILFLQGYFKGKWCVENVIGWYEPLIKPFISGSHYFWSNFIIPNMTTKSREHYGSIQDLEKRKEFDLKNFDINEKRLILRNCVEPELGLDIFNAAFRHTQQRLF